MDASAEWVLVHFRAGKDAPACQAVGWLQHEVGCPNLVYQNYWDLVLIKIPILQVLVVGFPYVYSSASDCF